MAFSAQQELRPQESEFDIERILIFLRRRYHLIAASVLAFFVIGLVYQIMATPQYTAEIEILIDSSKNPDQTTASLLDQAYDTGAVDSQVEVLKSDDVALGVVRLLHLDTDPAFLHEGAGPLALLRDAIAPIGQAVLGLFGSSGKLNDVPAEYAAVQKLQDNLKVKRVARTYVLTVDYTSPNPNRAMEVANAFADAYSAEQMTAAYDETRRASGWLQDRIGELKQKSVDADLAVQRFKAAKGIVESEDGKYVGDQQVQELQSVLSNARNDTAHAQARLDQISKILATGGTDAAVTDQLGNQVVIDLRQKYLKAAKTEQELEAKLGPDHYQVVALKNEMAQYQRQILSELQRTAETYRSDLDVAKQKERTLEQSMAALVAKQATSNETMVQLRELERESDTYKHLYSVFLQRYQDAVQRLSFPTSEARVISAASRPLQPSWPKALIVFPASILLGLMVGVALATYRESKDRVFRLAQDVRENLGLPLIGMVHAVEDRPLTHGADERGDERILCNSGILRFVLDEPLSAFSEVLRSAKIEADLSLGSKAIAGVLGIVSVLPNEGKTTIAKNFASLLATSGARTILIDADLRHPGLTNSIGRHAQQGLLDVLRGEVTLDAALLHEGESGLDFLPAVVRKRLPQSSAILASREMEALLRRLRETYDYVVVDLPPIGPVIDVRASERLFDAYLFVVEWAKTPRDAVSGILKEDPVLFSKTLGVLLNKVDRVKIKLYHNEGSKSYYYDKYTRYYTER